MNEPTSPPQQESFLSRYLNRRNAGSSHHAQTNASTWVAMVTAIIGGFVALSTYQKDVSKRIDQSVEKTFDMINTWNSDGLYDPRRRVLSYVYARRACDARLFSNELTDDDVVRVIEFFDLVQACVDADLCDAATAKAFFSPHANFQWPVLERTVQQMSESSFAVRSDVNFAHGLKTLAHAPIAAEPCDGNF